MAAPDKLSELAAKATKAEAKLNAARTEGEVAKTTWRPLPEQLTLERRASR